MSTLDISLDYWNTDWNKPWPYPSGARSQQPHGRDSKYSFKYNVISEYRVSKHSKAKEKGSDRQGGETAELVRKSGKNWLVGKETESPGKGKQHDQRKLRLVFLN